MATYPLTWLADVLRDAGCRVVEEGDWRHRGRDGSFGPGEIMLHHDASPPGETASGVDVIINGRPGLEGPLSQLWLSYDGVWHVIAAGRANHAGEGGPWGDVPRDGGNSHCIGIETDHTSDEQWTASQRSEGIKGVAALCRKLGINTEAEIDRRVLAHKEYAPDRKIDPDPLHMDTARSNLWAYMTGGEAPVRTFQKSCVTARTLYGGGTWKDLQFADEGETDGSLFVVLDGPASWYMVTVQAYVSGPAGTRFQLRPYRQTSGNAETYMFSVRDYEIPPDGTMGVELSHQGSIGDGWYLRVQGVSQGANLSVTKAWAEVATW